MGCPCTEICKHSKIKVEENGKKAVILNGGGHTFERTQVDGCLVKNAIASDWMVSRPNVGHVAIELKGCDVDHAVVQVEATLKYWVEKGRATGKLAALIVCSKYPKVNTRVLRAKEQLAKKFNAPLHVVTKNGEFEIEKLLSYSGPY